MRFKVTNAVEDESIGFQVNGSAMIISDTGQPDTAATPGAIIPPGKTQNFEWFIDIEEQEGGHLIQSHGGRDPSSLGLIGAFMVEPRGSKYLDPWTGGPLESGWMAMIVHDDAKDFREFALF